MFSIFRSPLTFPTTLSDSIFISISLSILYSFFYLWFRIFLSILHTISIFMYFDQKLFPSQCLLRPKSYSIFFVLRKILTLQVCNCRLVANRAALADSLPLIYRWLAIRWSKKVFSEALKTRTENRREREKEKKGVLKDFQLDRRKTEDRDDDR